MSCEQTVPPPSLPWRPATVPCSLIGLGPWRSGHPGPCLLCVPPTEGSIVFLRTQHPPGPFCQWSFVLTLLPAWSLVNTGSFVSCGQPQEAGERVSGKLRPSEGLRCFRRAGRLSLMPLPQLRGHTAGCPPEREGENATAGSPQPHPGALLPGQRQAPQTGTAAGSRWVGRPPRWLRREAVVLTRALPGGRAVAAESESESESGARRDGPAAARRPRWSCCPGRAGSPAARWSAGSAAAATRTGPVSSRSSEKPGREAKAREAGGRGRFGVSSWERGAVAMRGVGSHPGGRNWDCPDVPEGSGPWGGWRAAPVPRPLSWPLPLPLPAGDSHFT